MPKTVQTISFSCIWTGKSFNNWFGSQFKYSRKYWSEVILFRAVLFVQGRGQVQPSQHVQSLITIAWLQPEQIEFNHNWKKYHRNGLYLWIEKAWWEILRVDSQSTVFNTIGILNVVWLFKLTTLETNVIYMQIPDLMIENALMFEIQCVGWFSGSFNGLSWTC